MPPSQKTPARALCRKAKMPGNGTIVPVATHRRCRLGERSLYFPRSYFYFAMQAMAQFTRYASLSRVLRNRPLNLLSSSCPFIIPQVERCLGAVDRQDARRADRIVVEEEGIDEQWPDLH